MLMCGVNEIRGYFFLDFSHLLWYSYYGTKGGLVLTGKAADLKSAGSNPMGVRIPRPPWRGGRVAEGNRLLIGFLPKGGTWVRIPPSPDNDR